MSSNIKPGDLVMVIKPTPCCGDTSNIGIAGMAEEIPGWGFYFECDQCRHPNFDLQAFIAIRGDCHHISTLKKIDPPALDESVERVRELEQA